MEKRQRTSSSENRHDSLSTDSPGIKEKKHTDPDEINEEINSLSWEISQQHGSVESKFIGERVTIEEAFERVGGFGKFQKFSCVMNTLANMGAMFFLASFAFLEEQPSFKCQMTPNSD